MGQGKQYLFPFDIEAVCKNIKWGRGERKPENLGKKIKFYKLGMGKNIKCKQIC